MSTNLPPSTRRNGASEKALPHGDSITRTISPVYHSEGNFPHNARGSEVRIEGDILDMGVIFDEFELIRYIGGGGMGDVWLAQDSNLNRLAALKVLHSDKSDNQEVLRRFRSEAQVAAMLNHSNIAQIYSFREHSERRQMYIVMEFVPGENIRDWVKNRGPMPIAEMLSVALQIAHALSHLDAMNVVHRDIKPSNILYTPQGTAKLIDLGLARPAGAIGEDPAEDFPEGARSDITASGVTLGTFDYISPEQARDPRTVDVRSDIYSLGCTLYYMLTGHPPFPQGNALQKLLQHQSDAPMDVRMHRVDVPEALNQVLIRAMKKNRDERYSNPAELIHDLEMVAREVGLIPEYGAGVLASTRWVKLPEEKTPWFHWQTLRTQMFWIVPVLLVGIALVALTFLWSPSPEEAPPAKLPAAPVGEPILEPTPLEQPQQLPSAPSIIPSATPSAPPLATPASSPTAVPTTVPQPTQPN
ncbi:MAG: protein kinase [Planctomycetia bacterium]|nr:protein kinase [Planctomycetia bacterium]